MSVPDKAITDASKAVTDAYGKHGAPSVLSLIRTVLEAAEPAIIEAAEALTIQAKDHEREELVEQLLEHAPDQFEDDGAVNYVRWLEGRIGELGEEITAILAASIDAIDLKPGGRILVTYDGELSADGARQIRDRLRHALRLPAGYAIAFADSTISITAEPPAEPDEQPGDIQLRHDPRSTTSCTTERAGPATQHSWHTTMRPFGFGGPAT